MNTKKFLMLTGVAVVIAASGTSQLANAGIDAGGKPGSSTGSVTQFGSVFVNGVRFNTDNAVFIIDGHLGDESELDVGQVVSVFGPVDSDGENGTALIISYDDLLEGPVSTIDVNENRVTVLGQTVIINDNTSFSMASHAASIFDLNENDEITVSGFKDADGNIVATFVGDSNVNNGLELTGTISSVDPGSMTFAVNALQVDYSTANLYGLRFGTPSVGEDVEISGAGVNASGHLVADNVWAVQPDIFPGNGASGEVEGYVTRRPSWTDFEVDGTRIRVTWHTRFVNDWFFGLRLNRKVEVEGKFNHAGVLVAEKVDFERGAELTHRGRVDAVVDGLVYVDGMAIRVTQETTYDDDSKESKRRFHSGDLHVGDIVEIRGYPSGGEIVATWLERDEEGDERDEREDND